VVLVTCTVIVCQDLYLCEKLSIYFLFIYLLLLLFIDQTNMFMI